MSEHTEIPKRVDWHRLWGLMMTPLFERLGCETIVEMDLSRKEQKLDMVVINRVGNLPYGKISPDYYKGFENLNEHNLISFKSFQEVFNVKALEEFYGHYTNYKKDKNIPEKNKGSINLYAVTHHFPEKLFAPFQGTQFLRCIEKGLIYELRFLTPVRFIITRKITHPIIGLFSNDADQITASRKRLEKDGWLIKQVSSYLKKLYNFYFKEGVDMVYTQEMFIQDHYPEWHEKIQSARNEGMLEGKLEGKLEGMLEGKLKGEYVGKILLAQQILKQAVYSKQDLENKSVDELRSIAVKLEKKLNVTFH
ncbi:hypothetical protein QUF76_09100 [Desulfobacterales bacterium HSG16]|nr:hypothetical protein [Desulfobacterales bacterium HSG16]